MEDGGNRSFSDTHSSLILEYSSSWFEWSDCSDGETEAHDTDDGRGSAAVETRQYEHEASESESIPPVKTTITHSKASVYVYYSINECSVMPTAVECVCCTEIVNRKEQSQGFEPVCLDVWVLQTAYFAYRQTYGTQRQ